MTDHIKLNKYKGPNDPSFLLVYPRLIEIADQAVQVVERRRYRKQIQDHPRYGHRVKLTIHIKLKNLFKIIRVWTSLDICAGNID